MLKEIPHSSTRLFKWQSHLNLQHVKTSIAARSEILTRVKTALQHVRNPTPVPPPTITQRSTEKHLRTRVQQLRATGALLTRTHTCY